MKWTSKIKYINIQNEKEINNNQIKNNEYRIIYTTKKITHDEKNGTIEYTKYCRRNKYKQLQLY